MSRISNIEICYAVIIDLNRFLLFIIKKEPIKKICYFILKGNILKIFFISGKICLAVIFELNIILFIIKKEAIKKMCYFICAGSTPKKRLRLPGSGREARTWAMKSRSRVCCPESR